MRFLLSAMLACVVPARADDFGKMAAKISKAASGQARKRVAVLPFQSIGGNDEASGVIVSERLVGAVVDRGEIEVVERTLLQAVMREQQLEVSGLVNNESVKRLGRILEVDAVVTGTVLNLKDGRLEINARLIDAESARVLSVTAGRVDKEWSEQSGGFWNLSMPPLPSFEIAAPAWAGEFAGGGADCDRKLRAADQLEQSLVELKARYWALRLKDKRFSLASLKRNPGSEIVDENTRSRFYGRLSELYDHSAASRLTEEELERLNQTQREINRLSERCSS